MAERWVAVGDFIARHPDDVHPVTRAIIERGADTTAPDTFRAFYRLAELQDQARAALAAVDALMVPTVPAAYTIAEIEAEPIRLNSNLGTYTNFVNLLDICGLAVPAVMAADGTPFGVTLLAPAGQDAWLASIGRVLHAKSGMTLGALGVAQPALAPLPPVPAAGEIALAVVGAHLSGMPLNGELRALGARFLEQAATAPDYRLFALNAAHPPKPGLLRVAPGAGAAIVIGALGAVRRGVRALRRRGAGPADHRHRAARRRPHRQGIPGRGRGGRRRARHLVVRRLACVRARPRCRREAATATRHRPRIPRAPS